MKKIIAFLMTAVLLCALLCSCGKKDASDSNASAESAAAGTHPKVQFTMEENEEMPAGSFTIELYPEYAPKTVDSFLTLVGDGFYNGLTFHRVMDDFMAQGGDPTLVGRKEVDSFYGEFASNGFTQNTLSHTRGVVSMARTNEPNSASSQFFICYGDATFLDGNYAAFGKVIEGMETVDSFLKVTRNYNERGELAVPATPIVIASAVVLDDAQ